jgi:hypothetical protein
LVFKVGVLGQKPVLFVDAGSRHSTSLPATGRQALMLAAGMAGACVSLAATGR